jgi:hypothetical protein
MFIVIYEWRAKIGKETLFREAWRRSTLAITHKYGSLGSRLCQTADGRFIGAAEWPDRASWEAAMSRSMEHDDDQAKEMLAEALQDGGAPVLAMDVLDDLLIRSASGDRSE